MNAADITDKLGLHSLRQRNWYIQVCSSLMTIIFVTEAYMGSLLFFKEKLVV